MKTGVNPKESLGLRACVKGHFRLAVGRDGDDVSRTVADFNNLILDQGLDRLLTQSQLGSGWEYVHVGASSTPASHEQTGLLAPIARQRSSGSSTNRMRFDTVTIHPSDGAYEVRGTKSIRFPAGAAAGNIAEVGMGWDNDNTSLFCRALVRDANDQPTVIPVASDEYLDVIYTLSVYVDTSDRPFTLNLSSGDHDGVLRPANINGVGINTQFLASGMDLASGRTSGASDMSTFVGVGALGPVTGTATGSRTSSTYSFNPRTYTDGSFYRDVDLTLGLAQGNLSGGFDMASIGFSYWLFYQMSFNPPIPKTDERIFTVTIRITLARA